MIKGKKAQPVKYMLFTIFDYCIHKMRYIEDTWIQRNMY